MDRPEIIEIPCRAKVNLALSVGAADPAPGGFHPIASWMVAVQFSDHLTLRRIEQGPRSRLEIRTEPHAKPTVTVDWPTEKDLVYRAHRLLEEAVGRELPTEMTLIKKIPAQAGLGGGSSDAGAALVGLNRLHGLGLSDDPLVELGQRLGSDVGFLVCAALGHSSAVATGYGQQLEPLALAQPIHLVLIFPGFGCPTAPVYAAFDSLNPDPQKQPDTQRVRQLATQSPLDANSLFNDLAQPACQVRPRLRAIVTQAAGELGVPVHVTGSGSTLFAVAPTARQAQNWTQRLGQSFGLDAVATRTV